MSNTIPMKVIAHIQTEFSTKFGIPRQSGLVDALHGTITFVPEYRDPEALRGLEGFSHIWLLWHFSQAVRENWSPTVRPPRLGGNERMGVFATRSPFRPNAIGLSCVKLERIVYGTGEGALLYVAGADLMDGTPIFDIKPYLPYADCKMGATGGFAAGTDRQLRVDCPKELLAGVPEDKREGLLGALACDPRPHYQDDARRIYGMAFGGLEVRFLVEGDILVVQGIEKAARD